MRIICISGLEAVRLLHRVSKYEISQVGDEIEFVFVPSKLHFFDKKTEVNYLYRSDRI